MDGPRLVAKSSATGTAGLGEVGERGRSVDGRVGLQMRRGSERSVDRRVG